MNRLYIIAFVAVLLMVGSVSYAAYGVREQMKSFIVVEPTPGSVGGSAAETPGTPVTASFGKLTLRVGQTATFPGGLQLTPTAIVEDSRCPMNARCIHAGTVRVRIEVVSAMGKSTGVIELGKSVTTEAEEITLTGVEPGTMAGQEIAPGDYRLGFEVGKRPVTAAPPQGKCYVGGCSSQICSDRPDAVSTCEYREEYACYQSARCERQASGQCGWTETPELAQCLATTR